MAIEAEYPSHPSYCLVHSFWGRSAALRQVTNDIYHHGNLLTYLTLLKVKMPRGASMSLMVAVLAISCRLQPFAQANEAFVLLSPALRPHSLTLLLTPQSPGDAIVTGLEADEVVADTYIVNFRPTVSKQTMEDVKAKLRSAPPLLGIPCPRATTPNFYHHFHHRPPRKPREPCLAAVAYL